MAGALLEGKVIVVSGVGPGLGRTLALLAAADGASVVLGARTQDYLDGVVQDVLATGGRAVALATDIAHAEPCKALAEFGLDAFGKIDGLVNNAFASGRKVSAEEAGPEDFAACFDVTCLGTLRMSQAALPAFKANATGGSIVNVSTMGTVTHAPNQLMYATAKGAMNVLTRYLASEWGSFGVRTNLARMGWIGGATVDRFLDKAAAEGADRTALVAGITSRIPTGHIPSEEDCARSILFLLSDYSRALNGAVLDVNGGEFMPL